MERNNMDAESYMRNAMRMSTEQNLVSKKILETLQEILIYVKGENNE
jgi:hypothetical protein